MKGGKFILKEYIYILNILDDYLNSIILFYVFFIILFIIFFFFGICYIVSEEVKIYYFFICEIIIGKYIVEKFLLF